MNIIIIIINSLNAQLQDAPNIAILSLKIKKIHGEGAWSRLGIPPPPTRYPSALRPTQPP